MKQTKRGIYAVFGVIILLMAGLIYAWSVFSNTIGNAHPDWSKGALSLTFSLVMLFFCVGSLVAGILSKKVAPRVFLIVAAILMLAGFFVASLTQNSPVMLYIGFGALCGLGAGFAYNAVMGTASAWFPDKQGLISGVMLMGFGLSSFIIGKVFAAMAPPDGSDHWTAVFRIFGIIVFIVILVCGIFMRKPDADWKAPEPKNAKPVREPASDITTGQMVRKPGFWLFYIWAIMVSAAGLALVGQASGIATQVGPNVDAGTIATVVGLISIMNGVGRVLMGGIYDRKGYRFTMVLDMIIFFVAAAILALAIQSSSFGLVVLGFIVGGLAYSGVTPMQSALISDFYGRTNYSTNFSVVVTNLLIGSFASTIAGNLYDRTQSYMSTVLMMFIVTIVAVIVSIGVRRPKSEKEA